MIDRQQFLVRTRLEIETLEVWIKEEWLIPREDAAGQEFSDADIARTHLIKDLKQDFGVNDEGIGVILTLIDHTRPRPIKWRSTKARGGFPMGSCYVLDRRWRYGVEKGSFATLVGHWRAGHR